MTPSDRSRYLRIVLALCGLTFVFGTIPLMTLWPSGWAWGETAAHVVGTMPPMGMSSSPKMIIAIYEVLGVFLLLAAWNPKPYLGLIAFTIWSSFAHAGIMGWMAIGHFSLHWGHLIGDVPALIIVGAVLAWLCPDALLLRFKNQPA